MATLRDTETEILRVWEAAAGLDAWRRDDALLRCCGQAPQLLGVRNALLLELRTRLFGRALDLRSDCAGCGRTVEFSADGAELMASCRPPADVDRDDHELTVDGHTVRFRLPCSQDLREVAFCTTPESAAAALLNRCLHPDSDRDALTPAVRDALSARMEDLDPGATLSFAAICPDCGHRWEAPLDVGALLFAEVQAAAERTLLEVDALARAYGWTEPEIFALSPTRRAAYVQLAGSD